MKGGTEMPRTIVQTVAFKAGPEVLYGLYADSKKHSAATGVKANISSTIGGKCEAFEGDCSGTTLGLIRNRAFVQTWRGEDWTPDQQDSVLSLFFEKDAKGGRVTMVHANIPDEHYEGIRTGWTTYYWKPWAKYLAAKGKRK
jgi:activator of HSP90 ATPase